MKRLMNIHTLVLMIVSISLFAGIAVAAKTIRVKSADVEWTFDGVSQEKLLIDVIKSAKSTLDMAIYSITDPEVISAIKDAKKRGVSVRIITDKTQAGGKAQLEALKILGSAGVPIKLNSHSGLMHLKMTIADKKIGTTGSFNYSESASKTNDEVLVVIRNADVAKGFSAQFEAMWKNEKRFKTTEYKIAQPTGETNGKDKVTGDSKETEVIYANCDEVKKAGKSPLKKGQPGYSTKLDRDGDGVACEK